MTRGWGRRCVAPLLVALAVCVPRTAIAQSDPAAQQTERIGLRFSAPDGCANRDAFMTRVRGYTGRAQFVDDSSEARLFVVTIKQHNTALRGTLEIVRGEEKSARNVSASACNELIEALALMMALAIDPNALGDAEPEPEPQPKPKAKPAPPPAKTRAPPAAKRADAAQVSLGLQGLLVTGLLPRTALGGEAFANLRTSREASVRASFALALQYLTHGNHVRYDTSVAYAALASRIDGCAELEIARRWQPALCLGFNLGRQRSKIESPADAAASSGTRTWAAALLGLRLDWEITDAFALRAQGGVGRHLLEQRVLLIELEPNGDARERLLHETAGWLGGAGLGLLFHL